MLINASVESSEQMIMLNSNQFIVLNTQNCIKLVQCVKLIFVPDHTQQLAYLQVHSIPTSCAFLFQLTATTVKAIPATSVKVS